MYVCAHNYLPTLAILALGLLKKKDDEQFCMGGLGYLAFHKRILAVLKVATNADTTVENVYTVKSARKIHVRGSEEKLAFSPGLPLRRHITIRHVFSQSWHCYKLLCKRSSSVDN